MSASERLKGLAERLERAAAYAHARGMNLQKVATTFELMSSILGDEDCEEFLKETEADIEKQIAAEETKNTSSPAANDYAKLLAKPTSGIN